MWRLLLVASAYFTPSPACTAQIEWHPYAGVAVSSTTLRAGGVEDRGSGLLAGLDLLIGKNRIAPLVGVAYNSLTYDLDVPEGVNILRPQTLHYLQAPVGLAFRVLPPTYSINVVATAAFVPALELSEGTPWLTDNFALRGRAGVTLYYRFVSISATYTHSQEYAIGARPGRPAHFGLTLGTMY